MNKPSTDKNNEEKTTSKDAGRLMITNVPVVHPEATIAEAENLLINKTGDFESINYIYVTGKNNNLLGVVSVKEIFRSPKNAKVLEFSQKNLVTARYHTHQERVALLAVKHNLKAVPVVDAENRFLGVIPSDTILNILHEEHIEDLMRMAGVHFFKDPERNIIKASAFLHVKKRLPWLVLGLLGGMVAAAIVSFFENAIKAELLLAAFIPLVVYMADAVGTQTETIYIRSLALEHNLDMKKYFTREAKVGLTIGLILGSLVSLLTYLWSNSFVIGLILGISIFISNVVAVLTAMFLPWVFSKFKLDPAFGSGPFATVMRDILSLVVYFIIARLLLVVV